MAQSVKINEVTYESVPKIEIPLSSGTGKAAFWDTTGATAEAANVLTGKSIFGAAGEVEGTMPDNSGSSKTLTTVTDSFTIPLGYHDGKGSVSIDSAEQAKLIADNIKSGVTVLGVSGKTSVVETEDATAQASQIIKGQTAYVNGAKITGALTTISASQDPETKVLSIA